MEGLDGAARQKRMMDSLRDCPKTAFASYPVAYVTDHEKGETLSLNEGTITPTDMGKSNVLYYTLVNGDKIVVRPSGTEPKIKFYFLCHGDTAVAIDEKMEGYKKEAETLAAI